MSIAQTQAIMLQTMSETAVYDKTCLTVPELFYIHSMLASYYRAMADDSVTVYPALVAAIIPLYQLFEQRRTAKLH